MWWGQQLLRGDAARGAVMGADGECHYYYSQFSDEAEDVYDIFSKDLYRVSGRVGIPIQEVHVLNPMPDGLL